jgi:hypothetical protein
MPIPVEVEELSMERDDDSSVFTLDFSTQIYEESSHSSGVEDINEQVGVADESPLYSLDGNSTHDGYSTSLHESSSNSHGVDDGNDRVGSHNTGSFLSQPSGPPRVVVARRLDINEQVGVSDESPLFSLGYSTTMYESSATSHGEDDGNNRVDAHAHDTGSSSSLPSAPPSVAVERRLDFSDLEPPVGDMEQDSDEDDSMFVDSNDPARHEGIDHELFGFDQMEREDMFHCDVNHFPAPILSGKDGSLLHEVTCSFDVDSIYFVGPTPSIVLEYMGDVGTCEFQSAVSRLNCTQSSRIALDYHGVEDLLPTVYGRKLKRLKVICLHHFPNFQLVTVCMANVTFHLNLHILQPAVLTGNSYMTDEMLLTVICALNIAKDGYFPYGEDDDYPMLMDSMYRQQWKLLPYFELHDGSSKSKKEIHNSHNGLSLASAIAFFSRFEQALKLMSTSPELIDPVNQDGNEREYWKMRQGITFGGSGEGKELELYQLRIHASTLANKTIAVASAAGTKKTFQYPNMDNNWVGREHVPTDQPTDQETIRRKFSVFRREQFLNIKMALETTFPGLKPDHELFLKVHPFIDVGLEMMPIDDNRLLLADLQRSKSILTSIRYFGLRDVANLSVDMVNLSTDNSLLVVSGHDDNSPAISALSPVASDEEESRENSSVASDVSSDEEEPRENEASGVATGNAVPPARSNEVPSDFVDRFIVVNGLSSVSLYRLHFTRTLGCTHTGYVRMNPVQDPTVSYEKVIIEHPSSRFYVGGQIYEPMVRMESMHKQRPQRDNILSLNPHCVNICRQGGHLIGTSVKESMEIVAEQMKHLSRIYKHRGYARQSATSNIVRMELFVAYTNGNEVVDRLPDFDPTDFVDMFDKYQVDCFEDRIVQSHLLPCEKILGNLAELEKEGRRVQFEKFSPRLRTRVLGSLEIAVLYVAGTYATGFIIQRNVLRHGAIDDGITVDFPVSVQVNLSELERKQTGFDYGLVPCLLPLTDDNTGPPVSISQVLPADLSSKFPPYFSASDRSVVRTLNMGMNVGRLERARAQVNSMIHCYSRIHQNLPNDMDSGVMDDIAYELLVLMSADERLEMLDELARILILSYCHTTWELCMKHKVFGVNPEVYIDDDGFEIHPLEFENFPFVERKVREIKAEITGTSFVRKDTCTSTGKLNLYRYCLVLFYFASVANFTLLCREFHFGKRCAGEVYGW